MVSGSGLMSPYNPLDLGRGGFVMTGTLAFE